MSRSSLESASPPVGSASTAPGCLEQTTQWRNRRGHQGVTTCASYECQRYCVEIAQCGCGDTPPRITDNVAVALPVPCETSPDGSEGLIENPLTNHQKSTLYDSRCSRGRPGDRSSAVKTPSRKRAAFVRSCVYRTPPPLRSTPTHSKLPYVPIACSSPSRSLWAKVAARRTSSFLGATHLRVSVGNTRSTTTPCSQTP